MSKTRTLSDLVQTEGAITLPSGTSAERPANPAPGQQRFNTTTLEPEWYNDFSDEWVTFRSTPDLLITADVLVVAGGGGSYSPDRAGGGGAGGYRELTSQSLVGKTSYTVTVGAGGSGEAQGSDSTFDTITSAGGGIGAYGSGVDGTAGGSGGGGSGAFGTSGGAGNTPSTTPAQGFKGGDALSSGNNDCCGGGGGGASEAGKNGDIDVLGPGGDGLTSSIDGITRGGGGGGGALSGSTGVASGGLGGGGDGGRSGIAPTDGEPNTGGGAGGGSGTGSAASGGSGVVVVKYPDTFTITNPGGGLTFSTATDGDFKVTTFTAGTGNIQFGV